MNIKISEEESNNQGKSKRLKEEIDLYEKLHKRGSGCFGISRRSLDVKKHLDKLRKKRF
jgi:hypothetical protein